MKAPGPIVIALLLAGCGGDPLASQGSGTKLLSGEWHSFENEAGRRNYLLVVPEVADGAGSAPLPLVVYLHGCGRTVETAVASTGWNALAAEEGFAVIYPEQTDSGCWTWSDAAHQHRDSGEPSLIAGITREVTAGHAIDPTRIFVVGTSAGGYMAGIMGVTYPDIYAAVSILAGGPYGLGSNSEPDATGSLSYAEMGPRARVMPVFIAQSANDQINPAGAAELALQQWLGLADYADDGSANDSVSRTPASHENRLPEQAPEPGSGDACLSNPPNFCPGGAAGFQEHYPYTVRNYLDAQGEPLIEFWLVYGPTHTYASGDDPLGPDLTPAVYDFFLQHPQEIADGAPR